MYLNKFKETKNYFACLAFVHSGTRSIFAHFRDKILHVCLKEDTSVLYMHVSSESDGLRGLFVRVFFGMIS